MVASAGSEMEESTGVVIEEKEAPQAAVVVSAAPEADLARLVWTAAEAEVQAVAILARSLFVDTGT